VNVEDDFMMQKMAEEVLAQAGPPEPVEVAVVTVGDEIFDNDPGDIEGTAQSLAKLFRALGNPIRMDIVAFLNRFDSTARNLVYLQEMPASSVSHHLSILEQARIVKVSRVGRERIYSLAEEVRPVLEAAAKVSRRS
jgi:DNA-binding transcriptional ArsR family regulator